MRCRHHQILFVFATSVVERHEKHQKIINSQPPCMSGVGMSHLGFCRMCEDVSNPQVQEVTNASACTKTPVESSNLQLPGMPIFNLTGQDPEDSNLALAHGM